MNRPITSYPCAFSKHAATELSTPPLIASTTRCAMEPRFNPPPAVRPGKYPGHEGGHSDPVACLNILWPRTSRRQVDPALRQGCSIVIGSEAGAMETISL